MSVNSKMTAIADKIRALLGISGKMGLDAMATNLTIEQTNVSAAFTAIGSKGGTVPPSRVSGNLASAIRTIPTGSGGSVSPLLQAKGPITPTKSSQTIRPDSGYDGLSQVSIGAIPSEYIIPSGTKSITQNGTHDVNAYKSVSVNVASSGVTVRRKAGSFTTDNYNGKATVNCGFQPDVLLITGLYDSTYGVEYHAACVFPEWKNSSYDLVMTASPDSFSDGIAFYATRTTNGFGIGVYENNAALGGWYPMADMTFSYVAIKYTA